MQSDNEQDINDEDKDELVSSYRRQIEILQTANEDLQKQLEKTKASLYQTQTNLLNANTDNANLKEENAILRRNIAEYQKELDQLELLQVSQALDQPKSPMMKRDRTPGREALRRSLKGKRKKEKKKLSDIISGPDTETVIHVTGARMVNNEMTIIDNSGLLDPRVRKFLALAGIKPDSLNSDAPEKLEIVEKFANDNNVLELMNKREEKKKKRKMMNLQKIAHAPPPPPPPPPP